MANSNAGSATKSQSVAEDLAELGSHAGDLARQRYERMKNDAAEMVQEGRDRVEEMEHTLEEYIADHPIKSVLIAAGIGFLLGKTILR